MKIPYTKFIVAPIAVLLFSLNAAFAGGGVKFNYVTDEATYSKLIAKAEKEGKPVVLDFYTEWCGWCKKMDKDTFAQSEVGDFMNQNFVSIKLDAEQDFGGEMALKYDVSGFPTFVVLDPKTKTTTSIVGYFPPEKWVATLQAHTQG